MRWFNDVNVNVNVGERDENARRKKLIPAFLSNVEIDNFAALRNSYGNNMVHYILLGYGRKEYCANTCYHCKEFFHLGSACRRDVCVGIFSCPKTRHKIESHSAKRIFPTILNAISSLQYEWSYQYHDHFLNISHDHYHKKSLQLFLSITLTLTIIEGNPLFLYMRLTSMKYWIHCQHK